MAHETAAGAVKSAVRVLDLLELLALGDEMSHADIADALDIPKSSLTQLLKTLVARGYIDFDPAAKGYRLGDAFARFSRRANDVRDLVDFIGPILEDLTRETHETPALNQLNAEQAEVTATAPSPQRLLSNMRKGDVAPLYATSGGKAILAHLPEAMREEYVRGVVFEPITPKTIRSKKELARQIAAVRKDGFAYSFEEFTPGIIGIAVPILAPNGMALGAINIAAPAMRFNTTARERAGRALQKAAERIRRDFVEVQAPARASRSALA
jgi:DNA-binding IclR family transcriptional regulator